MTQPRAIALLSGGLDSVLSARLILDQGISVIGLHLVSPFAKYTMENVESSMPAKVARELGIEFIAREMGDEYFDLLKKPRFGFGRAMNPCIDCRILELRRGLEVMKERDAQFIITGEVVGQRPMSQHKQTIEMIEKQAFAIGLVLRPLSAKALKPTIAEEKLWVDREKLFGITGRSRKIQFELAEKFGIKEYLTPAGGCLLTDREFGKKVKDLLLHQPDFDRNDLRLLILVRHFRLSPEAKLVAGKNDEENKKIIGLARPPDLLIRTDNVPGPAGLLRGKFGPDQIRTALAIIAYYVHKSLSAEVPFELEFLAEGRTEKMSAHPIGRPRLEELRI